MTPRSSSPSFSASPTFHEIVVAAPGGPTTGHAVDAPALADDGHPLARHESPVGDGEARLERVGAEQRRDVLGREADEARRMWLADHVLTISKAAAVSVKRGR